MSLGPQIERNVTLKAAATRINSQRGSDTSSTLARQPGASFFASRNASAANTIGGVGGGHLEKPSPFGNQTNSAFGQQTNYMAKKQTEEAKHLKQVVSCLCKKLSDYQKQFISNKSLLATEQAEIDGIVNKPVIFPNPDDDGEVIDDGFAQLLGGHTIGPLIQEYEDHISALTKDIKALTGTVGYQAEINRELMSENEKLVASLEVKQREYLRLIEETRVNMTNLEQLGADMPTETYGIGNQDQNSRERIHLLTEENHILFEQVTLLRAHHDQFSKECAEKMSEAQTKITSFDQVKADLDLTSRERNELFKANSFLESKLSQTTQMLSQVEENHRTEHVEAKKMKEQLSLFQKEYSFYKNLAEKLETKQGDSLETLNQQLREIVEREKDQQLRLDQAEKENVQLVSQTRSMMADLTRQQRELKQLMAINEEYQLQANAFREREIQFTELSREYKEKLEVIKFEREKLALKEEQFVRQVHKAEAVSKQDSAKQAQIYESKLQSRQRDLKKSNEDLEDKLASALDEADDQRARGERLDKLNQSQRQSLEENSRKEERLILQYDKLLEQLRHEIKEKERELHAQDTRAAYAKQEVVKQVHEVQLRMDFLTEKMGQKESDILILKNDKERLTEDNLMLKAAVKEGDKTREVLARQMTHTMRQEIQLQHSPTQVI